MSNQNVFQKVAELLASGEIDANEASEVISLAANGDEETAAKQLAARTPEQKARRVTAQLVNRLGLNEAILTSMKYDATAGNVGKKGKTPGQIRFEFLPGFVTTPKRWQKSVGVMLSILDASAKADKADSQ